MNENYIEALIGDTPVSVQLNDALADFAKINHTHNYVSCEEFFALKKIVDRLVELVGDTPVSQQILDAIK